MRLGATEILLILAVALLLFGSNKISGLGKALGTSIREFKQEVKSNENPAEKKDDENASESSAK